jgi:predicted alpha/beta hydrolase family esterase
MFRFVTLPGIGGSSEDHWQSHWERMDNRFGRFSPSDWDEPNLDDWLAALEKSVRGSPGPVVLVAHSLACLLAVHAAEKLRSRITGAFLVAVPDPDSVAFPAEAASFREVPARELPFPALVVSSTNDPFGTTAYARRRAEQWGASLVIAGPLGHINAASRLAQWAEGRALLDAFCGLLSASRGRRRPDYVGT